MKIRGDRCFGVVGLLRGDACGGRSVDDLGDRYFLEIRGDRCFDVVGLLRGDRLLVKVLIFWAIAVLTASSPISLPSAKNQVRRSRNKLL
jgi:hypothetical protein